MIRILTKKANVVYFHMFHSDNHQVHIRILIITTFIPLDFFSPYNCQIWSHFKRPFRKWSKKWKNEKSTIMFIIFWDFLMIDQILLLPQVKRSLIICNKLVYKSCLTSCPPPEMEILSVLVKISLKTEIELFPQCAISHEN